MNQQNEQLMQLNVTKSNHDNAMLQMGAKAEELELDPSLLANKAQLIWLAATGDMPWEARYEEAHLMNWQRALWTEILQQNLPNAKRVGDPD